MEFSDTAQYGWLKTIISSLEELHSYNVEKNLSVQKELDYLHFAKEFKTIKLNLGRGIGYSTYIKNNASCGDCVIVTSQKEKDFFLERTDIFVPAVKLLSEILEEDVYYSYDNIYVDEASCLRESELKMIYLYFGEEAEKFFLLG